MVSSVSVIFYTGDTYSCSPNKGDFVNLEDNMLLRNIKDIVKGLDIYEFGIFEYSVRSESESMISLQDQAYYFTRLPKYLCIIS